MMKQQGGPTPSSPDKTIRGLVGAHGSAGVKRGPIEWRLVIHLAAWRQPGTEVMQGERRCEMPVTQGELQAFMQRIRPYMIVEAETEENTSDGTTQLTRLVQIGADDTELQQIAIELQKPIVIIHPTFGELQYDRRISSYDGHATWDGKDIELSLSCQSTDDPQAALEVALRLFKGQADWRGRANDYVVEDLLALKNECWLEDDEKELSRDEFLARITLESIAVQESGSFTFWYDDGGLFLGHAIEVRGHIDDGLKEAVLAG